DVRRKARELGAQQSHLGIQLEKFGVHPHLHTLGRQLFQLAYRLNSARHRIDLEPFRQAGLAISIHLSLGPLVVLLVVLLLRNRESFERAFSGFGNFSSPSYRTGEYAVLPSKTRGLRRAAHRGRALMLRRGQAPLSSRERVRQTIPIALQSLRKAGSQNLTPRTSGQQSGANVGRTRAGAAQRRH